MALRTDAFKLGLIENLTMVINQLLVTIVLILTLMTALIFMAAGQTNGLDWFWTKPGDGLVYHRWFLSAGLPCAFPIQKKTVCQWFRTTFLQTFFGRKRP